MPRTRATPADIKRGFRRTTAEKLKSLFSDDKPKKKEKRAGRRSLFDRG